MDNKRKFGNKAAILAVQGPHHGRFRSTRMAVLGACAHAYLGRARQLRGRNHSGQWPQHTCQRSQHSCQLRRRNCRRRRGRPLFGLADVEALSAKSAKALDRIFGKAAELAGMREATTSMAGPKFRTNPAGG